MSKDDPVIADNVDQWIEMVVFVNDVTHENPQFDAQQFKRGHVAEIRPAGVAWGKSTLTNKNWRVIKVFMSIVEASALLAREHGDPMANRVLRARAFKLDLDALDPITSANVEAPIDEKNHLNARIITIPTETIRALKVEMPKAIDPFAPTPQDLIDEQLKSESERLNR